MGTSFQWNGNLIPLKSFFYFIEMIRRKNWNHLQKKEIDVSKDSQQYDKDNGLYQTAGYLFDECYPHNDNRQYKYVIMYIVHRQ